MRSNKTKLGLSQWELDDKPDMDDFNEDNSIIERELQNRHTKEYVDAQLSKKVNIGVVAKPIYVSRSGSDNNNGSETSPYATIAKALNVCRSSPNISQCGIYLFPGTYTETFLFQVL